MADGSKASFVDNPVGSLQNFVNSSPLGGLLGTSRTGGPPITKVRSTQALSVHVQLPHRPPRLIGAVQGFDVNQSREIDEEYEIDATSVGLPVDLIPQRLSERTITVERLDLYLNLFEEVFNTREIITLTDQFMPLSLRELWRDPSGSAFAQQTRGYVYTGVFIKSFGRKMAATNDLIVRTNATFIWRSRIRVF